MKNRPMVGFSNARVIVTFSFIKTCPYANRKVIKTFSSTLVSNPMMAVCPL